MKCNAHHLSPVANVFVSRQQRFFEIVFAILSIFVNLDILSIICRGTSKRRSLIHGRNLQKNTRSRNKNIQLNKAHIDDPCLNIQNARITHECR